MPTTDEFRTELAAQIARATAQGRPHLEVNAGELHRTLGGYPPKTGEQHHMPVCCNVLWEEAERGNAEVIHQPPSGAGAAVTIRYRVPR